MAGSDECACCAGSPKTRFRPTGACSLATASGAEDAGVLLEAKAAADTSACTNGYGGPCPLDSWTPDTEPCGDGYDSNTRGWVGVVCDARGGRVVYVLSLIHI